MSASHDPRALLRQLPSIDTLLTQASALVNTYGHEATVNALRQVISECRTGIFEGHIHHIDHDALITSAQQQLQQAFRPSLAPVINATGVIIHTNLGRALLSDAAQQALLLVAGQYNTLEYDITSGQRGSRYTHAEAWLCELTGAEAALVVNNNAAALVLILATLGQGKEVIISRGQLVEIGGGFRIPDIMAQSGARLVEVGTTNRTHPADYERAITEDTAMLMRVHASNFKQIGFTQSVPLTEIVAIAHRHNCYAIDDLGSGTLLDTARYGLQHEPTVQESVQAGVDLVTFSGDKLLGGPQAGIIVGRAPLIDRLKAHPLARAFRADKLCYAALNATLNHYRRGEAEREIPVWYMIARAYGELNAIAARWAAAVGGAVVAGESAIGGGSLPGATLPTALLAIDTPRPRELAEQLRHYDPPVITRIADGRLLLDPRTVLPEQEPRLLAALKDALQRV